jgi:hypothetical protein
VPGGLGPVLAGARPHLLGMVLNRVPAGPDPRPAHELLQQAAVSVPVFETRIPEWAVELAEPGSDLGVPGGDPAVMRQFRQLAAELAQRVARWRPLQAAALPASVD